MPDRYGWLLLLAQLLQYNRQQKETSHMMMIFTHINSPLCTDWRRSAAARVAHCEAKEWFQNAPFCKETIPLKWMMLSEAGVATKYLLSCRDHNVPQFV